MNPYDIDYSQFTESKPITDKNRLLKMELIANLINNIRHIDQKKIAELTGLSPLYVSFLLVGDFDKFSFDQLFEMNHLFGFEMDLNIKQKQITSKASESK